MGSCPPTNTNPHTTTTYPHNLPPLAPAPPPPPHSKGADDEVSLGGRAVGEGVGARGEGDVCECVGRWGYGGSADLETEAEGSYLSVGPNDLVLWNCKTNEGSCANAGLRILGKMQNVGWATAGKNGAAEEPT